MNEEKGNYIAPMSMSLGMLIYSVRKQRGTEGDIGYTWYDVVGIKVKSLVLAEDERNIIINKGFEDQITAKQDDEEQFLSSKEAAVEIADTKNNAEKAKIAKHIENAKMIYEFYEDWQKKLDNGEIYKNK